MRLGINIRIQRKQSKYETQIEKGGIQMGYAYPNAPKEKQGLPKYNILKLESDI